MGRMNQQLNHLLYHHHYLHRPFVRISIGKNAKSALIRKYVERNATLTLRKIALAQVITRKNVKNPAPVKRKTNVKKIVLLIFRKNARKVNSQFFRCYFCLMSTLYRHFAFVL